MKVGRERYARKAENHAHNTEIPQKLELNQGKSGKDCGYLTGFLEKSSITRISLIAFLNV